MDTSMSESHVTGAVSRRRSVRGFTLIELLVVIAIIALLVSILLPSLKTAMELATQTTCAGKQRLLYMATMYYLEDHGDNLFTGYLDGAPWGFSSAIGRWWHPLRLGHYTDEHDFHLRDPSHHTGWWLYSDEAPMWFCDVYAIPPTVPRDYPTFSMNRQIGGRALADLPDATRVPLYACNATWLMCTDLMYWNNFLANAHRDGTIFMFADGHAQWIANLGGWSGYRYDPAFPEPANGTYW